MRLRRSAWPVRPTSALVLYALGMLSALAVSVSLGGAEAAPARWALIAVPAALLTGAGTVARWGARLEPGPGE